MLSDDGTITDETILFKWMKMFLNGMAPASSTRSTSALRYRDQLEAAGFVVQLQVAHQPRAQGPKVQRE
jgi:hypothetical protein